MKDTLFFARQRSGTTVLSYLLSKNGLITPPECMTARKVGRPREPLTYRFVSFCELNSIRASQIIEDPEGVLDQYLKYLKNYYDVENVALTAKTNQLYILPGSSYIAPYRPALVRYSYSRKLNVVYLRRKNAFRQYLSLAFANETGIFHKPVDKNSEMGRRPGAVALGNKSIVLDVDAADRAMRDAVRIGDLVNSWYANHLSYQEIVYEDIFDINFGVLTDEGAQILEDAFGTKIVIRDLELEKLQYDYRDHITNCDEVIRHFAGTEFEEFVAEVLCSKTSNRGMKLEKTLNSPHHEKYFACIGAQKAGTSWLHSYLRHNTSADMPAIKEFHWFDDETGKGSGHHEKARQRWSVHERRLKETRGKIRPHQMQFRDRAQFKSDADYRAFFERHCAPGSVFGDITPNYAKLDRDGFARIQDLFPKVKFIFLLRNPADRYWSALNMHAQRNNEYDRDEVFESQLKAQGRMHAADYQRTYEDAVSVVGRDKVFTAYHEDLFGTRRDSLLRDICRFLEIEAYEIREETLRDNRRTYEPMPPHFRKLAIEAYARIYEWALKEFGRVPKNWQADMENLNKS